MNESPPSNIDVKIGGAEPLFPLISILDVDGDVTFFKYAKVALISAEILIALNGQSAWGGWQ